MSKKLFAALSLSVLLAACQGSVTTDETSDTMMDENGAMMEDTSDTMMDDTTMEESSASSEETVEVEMDAGAAASVMAQ